MFNPKEMARIVIMGPHSSLGVVIERLHTLRLLHPIEFGESTGDFRRGQPFAEASELSLSLVKLRSMGNVLNLGASSKPSRDEGQMAEDKNLRERILALELNMYEDTLAKKETEDALRDARQKIEVYKVFAALGLPLDYYSSYRSLAVFVGTVKHPTDDLPQFIREYEIARAGDAMALFVPLDARKAAETYLAQKNFTPLDPPGSTGDPHKKAEELASRIALLELQHKEAAGRMDRLKDKHASFIFEAEKILARDVEKAEAPLMCAASDHAFVMDGWLPLDSFRTLAGALEGIRGVHVESVLPEGAEPPVLLENPAPSRPFEMLLSLYSTPSYQEIDPTVVLSLVFPLFLGFMIGDAGFGLVMMALGLCIWKSLGATLGMKEKTASQMGFILIVAGLFSVLFGLFVFAEFLAVPLHPTPEAKIEVGSWSEYLGIEFPFVPLIHKIEEVTDLLVISIAAAGLHLGVGYVFGMRNALRHDRKHALAKLGWLIILLALISEIMLAVRGTRAGGFIVETFLPFVTWESFSLGKIPFSPASLAMLATGVLMILPAEGVMALPEVIGLFANILSYARLAGIAVAETAIALGFIKILLLILSSGNIMIMIVGCLVVLMVYALVFVLGMIAASIQDVRLNYVEFFRKFFEGNGVPFRPFGMPADG